MAQAQTNFTDIDGSFAKDAILKLAEQGIITGKGDGQFNPSSAITRQDFAIILAKSLKLDLTQPPATATFSDIPNDHYAFAAVEAAAKAGLIQGLGDGSFGRGANLSRQDMAVIFGRALNLVSGEDHMSGGRANLGFSDSSKIAEYAKDAVGAAFKLGYIGGSNGAFDPNGSATREQVASLTTRWMTATNVASAATNRLLSASAAGHDTVVASFSRALTSLDGSELTLSEKATGKTIGASAALLSDDGKTATVSTDALSLGTTYALTYKSDTVEFATPMVDRIEVATSSGSVYPGGTANFSAKAYGGTQLLEGYANLVFAWSADGGTVNANGSFTASRVGGASVTADWNGVAGKATITVLPSPAVSAPEVDTTRPVVTVTTVGPVTVGEAVYATSSESGTMYLVDEEAGVTPTVSTLDTFSAIVDGLRSGTKVSATAGQSATLTTNGLRTGNYYVFATDASGNLSLRSSAPLAIGPKPTLTKMVDGPLTSFRSSLIGTAYVVDATTDVSSVSDLIAAVNGDASLTKLVTANQWFNFNDIGAGVFNVYVATSQGIISDPIEFTSSPD
jgi:hypothetical protein